jgi:hypothetical protein
VGGGAWWWISTDNDDGASVDIRVKENFSSAMIE